MLKACLACFKDSKKATPYGGARKLRLNYPPVRCGTSTASPVGGSCSQPCRSSARAPCSTSLLRNQNKTFDLRQREAEAKEIYCDILV